nr:uncharacterized protein LOC113404279 [Vanessa tameamea]XP_026500941.1 uncharacterized protein LOC113404279 [Vanessa tameamea]XP_026500949.1 uncharacterized protein LOC113404279 [Vanessa tameamea]
MKKSKNSHVSGKKSLKTNNPITPEANNAKPKLDSIDEDEQGFGGWLRSSEGLENMKLFVIANSIVLLTTITYPHIQFVIEFITDALYGPDSLI